MKKICFVVSNSFFVNAFLYEPISILSANYKIYLICNIENNDNIKINHPNIDKIFSIKIKREIAPISDLISLVQICKIIKTEKFNAVHTLTPKAGLLGILASYLMKVPNRFHTFTGQVWISKTGVLRSLLIAIDRLIIKLSSKIIIDGKSQKEFLIKQNFFEHEEAIVFNNISTCGINLNKFKPDPIVRKQQRIKYKVSKKDTVFCFLGRINKDKGIYDLIESFLLLDNKNIHLFLIGPLEIIISDQTKEKYKRNNIRFLPYTKQPQIILQLCDVFCFPSYREGFGYSVIEASALEKPVICSDIYGLKYTCLDNQTGLKHKVKSVKSLLNKMRFAIENPDIISKMGGNGRKYVHENFSEDKVLEKWFEFYSSNL